jgi:hypothetical protein
MAVHEFWRHDADDGRPIDAAEPKPFKTTMPNSPLSYEGLIVTIRWCVRVRVFLKGGRDLIGQRVFRLGDVPAIRPRAETD